MGKIILIVEDNYECRRMEKDILAAAGYDVLEAKDAKTGIALAQEKIPDLIIMDIRLPSKKRGIGAVKILRKDKETSHIPVIFVTGYAQGEQTTEVRNIDNFSYLVKPFEPKTLVDEVKKYIG
ncbi:MAG: response regulator [Candidatus Omnitrophota bacterium]